MKLRLTQEDPNVGEGPVALHRKLRRATVVSSLALLMLGVGFVGTGEAAHVSCGQTLSSSTTLDSDVGPCPGDGLRVNTDGITLNLNGKRVFAANGQGDNAGIRLMGVKGVTVTGGTVEKFDAGVVIGRGSGNTVQGVTAQDNVNDFLRTDPTIPGSAGCELGDGIAILDSSNNTIVGNKALRNGPFGGISVVGDADANVIRDNVASDNKILGVRCGNSRQDEGVRIEGPGANGNRVENNRAERNLLAGIGLHGYVCGGNPADRTDPNSGTVIKGNAVTDTKGTPIAAGINFLEQGPAGIVCPAFGNTVDRNSSTGNQADGIFVAANSHDNVINRNRVDANDLSGIFLNDPVYNNEFTNVGPTLLDLVNPDRPPYVQGTDYRVMSGSGSGDVTARVVAIDINVPANPLPTNTKPVDTSTSGCEQADYDAAGFQAGDVALIQRGTCTFVSKVNLAIANGASAVVMFNEGQANRTTFAFGAVGPVPIPVISTTYAVGVELYNLTLAGPVTIHVVTNTTNERVLAAPAPYNNTLFANRGFGNGDVDGYDGNLEPPCDNNKWRASMFGTVNQACVVGPGGSGEAKGRTGGPGRSEDAGQEIGRNAPPATAGIR